jgi:hypothetical protein
MPVSTLFTNHWVSVIGNLKLNAVLNIVNILRYLSYMLLFVRSSVLVSARTMAILTEVLNGFLKYLRGLSG